MGWKQDDSFAVLGGSTRGDALGRVAPAPAAAADQTSLHLKFLFRLAISITIATFYSFGSALISRTSWSL